jgi:transcriptional regulator NrdR family protein
MADRRSLLPLCDGAIRDTDVLRRRACDWCATELVTSERIEGLITPPLKDRMQELTHAKKGKKNPALW